MNNESKRFSDPMVLGTNQSGMRAQNERLLLTLLHQRGRLAKRDITKLTGLSAQTVSVIMRQLEADGLLIRGEPVRGKVGQPSVPLSLNPNGACFLGLKVGRRNAELVLINFVGEVMAKRMSLFSQPQPDSLCQFVERAMREFEHEFSAEVLSRIAGLGIALPFKLWEWGENGGKETDCMTVWRNTNLREQFTQLFDFPVYLQNDGTAACGAELAFGEHSHLREFVYFHIGSFVGGGVVINGSVYAGRSGNAGALGSMPLALNKQLIDEASIINLEQRLAERGCDCQQLWAMGGDWHEFEPEASAWIAAASSSLAQAIAAASSVIDFEAAVVDGAIPAPIRARLVRAIARELSALKVPGVVLPPVFQGSVGSGAKALGAASLVLFEKYLIDTNRRVPSV